MGFFRGFVMAVPIGIALWVLIVLVIYFAFFSSPPSVDELAAS